MRGIQPKAVLKLRDLLPDGDATIIAARQGLDSPNALDKCFNRISHRSLTSSTTGGVAHLSVTIAAARWSSRRRPFVGRSGGAPRGAPLGGAVTTVNAALPQCG